MPSDGILFDWFPTVGHAFFGMMLMAFIFVGCNIWWHLLTDDDGKGADDE